jgi:hypothetical protein
MESRTPSPSSPPSSWARIAEARSLGIPAERLENIAPTLDDLEQKTRRALDRDLSLAEPMFSFKPVVSAPAAAEEEG